MSDTKPTYVPPSVSWRLLDFVEALPSEIEARVVTCETCPVAAKCAAGVDGTGWSCNVCRATGVHVDDGGVPLRPTGGLPDDVLVLDCTKHRFATRKESTQVAKCTMCNGAIMEMELLQAERENKAIPRGHYVATAYAAMPVAERQAQLKASLAEWREKLSFVDEKIRMRPAQVKEQK